MRKRLTLPALLALISFVQVGLFVGGGHCLEEAKASRPPPPFIADRSRVVFLGASNTYAGGYVALIAAHFHSRRPDGDIEILNLGLPSETASGLSEPDHPFPRPDVHERLDRVLARTRPDVVVATYGMNDGIYYPFSEERFAAYRKGMRKLIEKVKASGAKLVLITPAAFDPLPMRRTGKLRPASAEKFAWFAIYEGYDAVMRRYADWVMARKGEVDLVIDVHKVTGDQLARRRASDPDYTMSSDGVHFGEEGHRAIAAAVLETWGEDAGPVPDGELRRLVTQRQELLRDAWLTEVGHKRPGVKKGLPLSKAQAEAAALERAIRSVVGDTKEK